MHPIQEIHFLPFLFWKMSIPFLIVYRILVKMYDEDASREYTEVKVTIKYSKGGMNYEG